MSNSQTEKPKKVAVGMSGGVDSSVAAHLLVQQGYDVTGVFMQCWDEKADGCRADEDRKDAVEVASKLGIKFETLDFKKEYKARVISYFYDEYKAGRTPNPDVMCNKEIKFGLFMEWALEEEFDYVATGHYARVEKEDNEYKLLKGVDSSKDQSYFLYLLGQEQLKRTLFPLGELKKTEIRKLAKEVGLHTYSKPDSVGICFIGEVDIKDFLKKEISPKEGKVVNSKGEVLGRHEGVWYYTIGQRHGFTLDKYVGLPLYVIDKNVSENKLVVGFSQEVNRGEFNVGELSWVRGSAPKFPLRCDVRIRHLGELHTCTMIDEGTVLMVSLKEETFGIAPGQSAVFYVGDELLGGGIIQ